MAEFAVTSSRQIKLEEGWGVIWMPVWEGGEDMPSRIAEIYPYYGRIYPDTIEYRGGVPGIMCTSPTDEADQIFVPADSFEKVGDLTEDDTHDFRSRWFATEEEAKDHITFTLNRFNHPSPWESFVRFN